MGLVLTRWWYSLVRLRAHREAMYYVSPGGMKRDIAGSPL